MWYVVQGDYVYGMQGATTIIEHMVNTKRGPDVAREMYLRTIAKWIDVDYIEEIRVKPC